MLMRYTREREREREGREIGREKELHPKQNRNLQIFSELFLSTTSLSILNCSWGMLLSNKRVHFHDKS